MTRVIVKSPMVKQNEYNEQRNKPAAERRWAEARLAGEDSILSWHGGNRTQSTPPKGTTKTGLLATLGPGLVTGASDVVGGAALLYPTLFATGGK